MNLASRLEGANKFYKTNVMISETTYKQISDDFECRQLDRITVVGKLEPIYVYELIDYKGKADPDMMRILEYYNDGKDLYRKKKWPEARKAFKEALTINPEDGPSQVFSQRSAEYIRNPKAYTGVYSLLSK